MKVYNIDFLYCNDLNTLLFPPNILNLRKTVTNVVVIVIESEEPYVVIFFGGKRFGMQTVRVPVGRVPQIKHTCEGRKIPFIKNACNNFDEKK
jgi:hypothetical protein